MALSDHEQQLLDQLEKQLREDPSFARNIPHEETVRIGTGLSATRVVIGVVAVVVGLAVVLGGIWMDLWPLGVVGFAVMVGGGFWALSTGGSSTSGESVGPSTTSGSGKSAQKSPGFMDRMEGRWNKRQGE